MAKKLILIVIDGLTPTAFEGAAEDDRMPALKFLAANGAYARGISTFPSLTPVCLSSIATGAHPDVHRIPHLVWYHRGERRIVEYGSSFAAVRAAGARAAAEHALVHLTRPDAPDHFWVHVDADVLDDTVMPAVDYRQPGGLSADELATILAAATVTGLVAGVDVTIYNPALDPAGTAGAALTGALARGLGGGDPSPSTPTS